jgi:orotidine-5'-phosphate decarboxylase
LNNLSSMPPAFADEKIIVALDVPSADRARDLVSVLKADIRFFKVGLELFSATGPDFVRELKQEGLFVFLDLKLYDIPNTVRAAVDALSRLEIDMLTIHLAGGEEMCRAALLACREILLLGVTVLTSQLEETLQETGVRGSVEEQVLRLAHLARTAGLSALVASPQEAALLRNSFGSAFRLITPGVRPVNTNSGDQKRTMTPREALLAGADHLVIGRPITAAPDPKEAARLILKETLDIAARNQGA